MSEQITAAATSLENWGGGGSGIYQLSQGVDSRG